MTGGWSVLAGTVAAEAGIAFVLSLLVLRRYVKGRHASHLYWGIGLLLVGVTMAQELVFYLGVWSEPFAQAYLVLVAVLVGILSLGSAELLLHGVWRRIWFGYVGLAAVAMVAVGVLVRTPSSIVVDGVVTGLPPPAITAVSLLVTVPSSILLIVASLYGAFWKQRYHLLFVAVGTGVFAAAGALFLVSFPLSLYYAEFAGAVLLFLGFVRLPTISLPKSTVPTA